MEKKKTIVVSLAKTMNTLFVIDGVDRSIKDADIEKVLLNHFESMYGQGEIKVKPDGNDFFVTIRERTVNRVTWSFTTTYVL
jgi:hypothetical protein